MKEEKRLSFYEISSLPAKSLKTFDGKMYMLKGAIAVEPSTGEIERVADIYYRVRSVIDEERNVIAKRKNRDDELVEVIHSQKVKH
ncbi:hypothetical protein AC623_20670 [Bacillus sp. FJAT-27231]|uniref:hypothetical protein n=1 Tax=Bacillus sp. FJAT-27231 TaxID=1679168 RepID=UPI0006713E40|nr:hypothetical protein [Bacillus sp. FJAT-27231]KMY52552.1 hypothetical protein AC623_20670 [Bacillus sp. FJAT-27231]